MQIIRIKDYYGKYQEVPVSDELFEEWQEMKNEHQRGYRKEYRHRDKTTLDELDMTSFYANGENAEDEVIRHSEYEALYEAIKRLTPTQQRRILMYMEDVSIREIARREGCHMNAVLNSVNAALANLRKILSE
jgi:DNA-directed RNA polymerase specialized sigma24 family protein